MSDGTTIILALVPCISATVAAAMGMANNAIARRNERKLNEQANHNTESRKSIAALEKNTNSMKDALVKVVGEAEFAKGLKAGREGTN
jgi:flagellar biosynthesis component FlhA